MPVVLTRHLGIGLDDMFQYDMLARSLTTGNGYRWYAPADLARMAPYMHLSAVALHLDARGLQTTFRAPLYPFFLSLIYSLSGINDSRFFAARLAQAVLGAALAPLTYFVARSVLRVGLANSAESAHATNESGEKSAKLSAWVVALYPTLLLFPLALATENLFFILLLLSLLVLLMLAHVSHRRAGIGLGVIAGCLLGLTALTRSVILPFAALAVLWVWWSLRLRLAAVAVIIGLVLTISPWIIRNSLLEHRLTGIETSMGYNLYVGYHPQSTGTFLYGPSLDLLSIIDDRTRDEYGTQRALRFIEQDPVRFPYLAVRRLGYFFNMELRGFTYFYTNNVLGYIPSPLLAIILLMLALPFLIVSLSAAVGWSLLPRHPEGILLLLLFIGYLLPHVLVLSEERFHLALVPVLAIPAAALWARGLSRLPFQRRLLAAFSFVIVVLLIANWGSELMRDGSTIIRMLGPAGNQLYLSY